MSAGTIILQVLQCIICLHEFIDEDDNPRSDEHIIPEFLGGDFKIGILCKQCNNKMGGGFEDRLAKDFLVKAYANKYRIVGKSGKIPNSPLVGDYEYQGKNVFFAPNYSVKTHPSINCINENEKLIISGHIDANNIEKSKEDISKKLERLLKKQGIQPNKHKINSAISAAINNSTINKVENIRLKGRIEFNLNDFTLLFMKIAYEALCITYGEDVLLNSFYHPWRQSLSSQKISPEIQFRNLSFFDVTKSTLGHELINTDYFEDSQNKDNALIIFSSNTAYVRLLGMWHAFQIHLVVNDSVMYEHIIKTRQLFIYTGDEFIKRLIKLDFHLLHM